MSGRDVTADGPAEVRHAPLPGAEVLPDVGGFTHAAVLHDGEDLDWTGSLLHQVAAGGFPAHVIATARTQNVLRAGLDPLAAVRFDDMTELGRNPARIIPAALSFSDEQAGQHLYCVWEPAWPSRSAAELHEVARHEALVNLAFKDHPMTVACLYDTSCLPGGVLRDAELTHPVVITSGRPHSSRSYLDGRFPPGCDDPLPPAASDATSVSFESYLAPVREFSASRARAAGLDRMRASDLVLAVSEIAANALGHAGGGGVVRAWCTGDELICQIEDYGCITDPLAGRRRLPAEAAGGHGLWLVNRVCDLVERRTGQDGTITRLHMRRAAGER
ncbi:MAG: anti-sigma factor RsbA family regulatory protein [Streptosporangiaceae bacterium]